MNAEILATQSNQGIGGYDSAPSDVKPDSLKNPKPLDRLSSLVDDRVSISASGKGIESKSAESGTTQEKTVPSFEPSPAQSSMVSFKMTDDNQLIMVIIDKETREVIKQYPPEVVQKVGQAISKFIAAQRQKSEGDEFSGVA